MAEKSKKSNERIQISTFFDIAKKIIIAIISFITLVFLIFYVVKISVDNKISIEFLPVPRPLTDLGYSELTVGQMYIDEIHYISTTAKSVAARKEYCINEKEIDISIPFIEKEISVGNAKSLLQNIFDIKSNTITGFIRLLGKDSIVFTTRYNSNLSVVVKGKMKDFENIVKKSVEEQFKFFDPYILASYYETNDLDLKSVETIKYIITKPPVDDDKWAYNLWGALLMKHEWYDDAKQKFKKAISMDSLFFLPYYNLGLIASNNSSYNLALKYYQKSLKLSKNKFDLAFTEIADVLLFRKEYEKADKNVDEAIKRNPLNGYSYYTKAQIYLAKKDTSKAIEFLDKAVEVDNNENVNQNTNKSIRKTSQIRNVALTKAKIFLAKKDTSKAIELLNIFIGIDSTEASYYSILATIKLLQKDLINAERTYSKAYSLNPNDYRVAMFYIMTLKMNGNTKKADSINKTFEDNVHLVKLTKYDKTKEKLIR